VRARYEPGQMATGVPGGQSRPAAHGRWAANLLVSAGGEIVSW